MSNAIVKREADELGMTGLADHFVKSGFFQGINGISQAVVKMQAGNELNVPPMAAMRGIQLIKGKISLDASLQAALVKKSGRYNYRVKEHTDKACEIEFTEDKQPCGSSRFTIDDAMRAGLTNNPTYKAYPRNMLFARAMSNGCRWYCPDIFQGAVYGEGEIIDETPAVEASARVEEQGNRLLAAVTQTLPVAEITVEPKQLPEPVKAELVQGEVIEPTPAAEPFIDSNEAFQIKVAEALESRGIKTGGKGSKTYAALRKFYKVPALLNLNDHERGQLIDDIIGGKHDNLKETK
jgi:hypothetical protein